MLQKQSNMGMSHNGNNTGNNDNKNGPGRQVQVLGLPEEYAKYFSSKSLLLNAP